MILEHGQTSSAGTSPGAGGADNPVKNSVPHGPSGVRCDGGTVLDGTSVPSDEVVLARSLKEPEAFAELVRRYEAAFLRRAERMLYDKELARDVVQDTFTKIYVHGASFKKQEGASFKSWAYRILFTTSLTAYRKAKRDRNARVDIEPEMAELLGDNGEATAERLMQEDNDTVVRVMKQLPTPLARVLQLMYWGGLSGEEIAEKEGISHEAVRARVHRAKKKFKSELEHLENHE